MSKLRVYLTNLGKYNEGELVGEWVDLPVSEDELQAVYDRIGISDQPDPYGNIYEETFITDYESDIDGLYVSEYDSIDHLNELATKLEELDDSALQTFQAACDAGHINIEDLEDFDPNNFVFIPDVYNDESLGYYCIDEYYGGVEALAEAENRAIARKEMDADESIVRRYFDFREFGREFAMDFNIHDWVDIPYDDVEAEQQLANAYGVDNIDDIDAYTYFGVSDDYDLGEAVTDGLPYGDGTYFDYEQYGKDTRDAEGGAYTDDGYVAQIG